MLNQVFPRPLRLVGCFASLLLALSCDAVVDTKGREPCTTSSECTARFGEPSACVKSACTKLLTKECTEIWPPDALTQDNVLLIGFMGALQGDSSSYGTPPKEGAELAIEEIETNNHGLPAAPGQNGQRHLAMLVCDHGADPSQVARHLVADANVPVIIGGSFSSTTLQIFDDVAHAANVLVLSPSATSPALTTHADDGLLWRTAPSDVVQAELLKFLVVDVEQALHARLLSVGKSAKIAMPTKNDSAGLGLAAAATSIDQDSPNPAPVVNVGLPDQYPNPDTQPKNQPVSWEPHIQSILDYTPDVIMAMGTGEFVVNMMPEIEGKWDPSLPRPWYILPEGDRVSQLTEWVANNPSYALNERIIGTAPGARRSTLYAGFRNRFLMANDQREPGNLAEFGYDAAYLVAYAIAIANQAVPSGRQLADAMKQMSCHNKTRVPSGPTDFSGYFSTAARDGCIDFDGASGPLDFNPDTGEALSDIAMWCVHPTQDAKFSFEPTLDTYYSVEQSAVTVVPGKAPLDLSTPGWCGPSP